MENNTSLSDSVKKVSLNGDELIIGLDGRNISIPLSVLKQYLGIAATGNIVPAKAPSFNLGAPAEAKVYVGGKGNYTLDGVSTNYPDEVNFFFWNESEWDVFGVPIEVPYIVNDLTTGGADKALSAEKGKELSNEIINITEKDFYSFGAADNLESYGVITGANQLIGAYSNGGFEKDGLLQSIEFYVARAGLIQVRLFIPTGDGKFQTTLAFNLSNLAVGVHKLTAGVDFPTGTMVYKNGVIATYLTSTGRIGYKTKETANTIVNTTSNIGGVVNNIVDLPQVESTMELGLKATVNPTPDFKKEIDVLDFTVNGDVYKWGASKNIETDYLTSPGNSTFVALYSNNGVISNSYIEEIEVYVVRAGTITIGIFNPTGNANEFLHSKLISINLAVGYHKLIAEFDFEKNILLNTGAFIAVYSTTGSGAIGVSTDVNTIQMRHSGFVAVGEKAVFSKQNVPQDVGILVTLRNIGIPNLNERIEKLESNTGIINQFIKRATNENRRNDHVMVFRCKDGTLGAVYQYFYTGGNDFNESNIAVSYSRDKGKTWSDPILKPKTVFAEANPDIYINKKGDLIVFYASHTVSSSTDRILSKIKSIDNGITWGEPITYGLPAPGGTGALRASNGNVYYAAYENVSGSSSANAISEGVIYVSDDDGETFEEMARLSDTNPEESEDPQATTVFEPGIYETTPGTFIFYHRSLKSACRARKSTDYGQTWGESFNLIEGAPNSLSCVKKINITHYDAGLNPISYTIYIAAHNYIVGPITSHSQDRVVMCISLSLDGELFQRVLFPIYRRALSPGNKGAFEPNICDDGKGVKISWSTFTTSPKLDDAVVSILSYEELNRIVNTYFPE